MDLEVHCNPIWRVLRNERSDVLLIQPEGQALTPSSRWKPMLRTLITSLKRHVQDTDHLQDMHERALVKLKLLEGQVGRTVRGR